jgi:hypothetical protein
MRATNIHRHSLSIALAAASCALTIAACGSSSSKPSGSSSPYGPASSPAAMSRCMRANGVPNFPDPDANGNIQFPITSPIPQSPAFQHAQNGPCKKYLSR